MIEHHKTHLWATIASHWLQNWNTITTEARDYYFRLQCQLTQVSNMWLDFWAFAAMLSNMLITYCRLPMKYSLQNLDGKDVKLQGEPVS
jgi:hypothetical protein